MAAHPGVTPNRRGIRSRELVLDAAERVMAEHGYEAATLARVVDEAGIPYVSPMGVPNVGETDDPCCCCYVQAYSCPEPGMAAGMAAAISIASSGRACQVSLQREQRTVRPPGPRVAGLMA